MAIIDFIYFDFFYWVNTAYVWTILGGNPHVLVITFLTEHIIFLPGLVFGYGPVTLDNYFGNYTFIYRRLYPSVFVKVIIFLLFGFNAKFVF